MSAASRRSPIILWTLVAVAAFGSTALAADVPPAACAELRGSVRPEPAWYASVCLSGARVVSDRGPRQPQVPGDTAYMLNLSAQAPNAQTLLGFALPNADAPSPLGTQARSLFAMDFDDPSGVLWAIDDASRELGRLDTTNAGFTSVVVVTGVAAGDTITGLAIDPRRGGSYISTSSGSASSLYALDRATGVATLRGAITGFPAVVDIAMDCEGLLIGHDVSLDQMLEIDPLNGAPTLIGSTGLDASFSQGMDFDNSDGTLYAWIHQGNGQSLLTTVDLQAGTATPVATPPSGQYEGAIPNCCFSPKGNFNSDASVDLLFRHTGSNRQVVWLMSGVERLNGTLVTPDPGADWRAVGSDDFDDDSSPGDGPDGYRSDLLLRNVSTGALEFWLMNGTTRVGPPIPLGGATPLPLEWELAATGDFDADDNPDLLWRHTLTGQLLVWRMAATTKLGELVPSPDHAANANWTVRAALDFDHDGWRDLLWYNGSSGKLVLWLLDGALVRRSGSFTQPAAAADANWNVVAGGDYGQGPAGPACSSDIVWRNESSGKIVVWRMDFAGQRASGTFLNPPAPTDLRWRPIGPR